MLYILLQYHFIALSWPQSMLFFYTSGSDAWDLLSETEGQCRRGLRERTKMAKSKNGDGTEWPDAGAKCWDALVCFLNSNHRTLCHDPSFVNTVCLLYTWLYYIIRSAEALVFFFKEIYLRQKRHWGKPCVDCDGGGRGATAWTAARVGICRRRISACFRVFVTPPER